MHVTRKEGTMPAKIVIKTSAYVKDSSFDYTVKGYLSLRTLAEKLFGPITLTIIMEDAILNNKNFNPKEEVQNELPS